MAFQIAAIPLTNNGNADFDIGAGYVGRPITIRASSSGSGTIAGTVTIRQGSLVDGAVVYDTGTAAGTLSIAGTGSAADSVSFQPTGNRFWRAVLSGVSAATTVRIVVEVA